MVKQYNPPVSIQVYLGSGKLAQELRDRLVKAAGDKSLSEYVVRALLKVEPALAKGLEKNGKK